MKFYCIGDEDTVRGLRLAGIAGRVAADAPQAAEAAAYAAAQGEYGVVIIAEKTAALIRPQLDALREKQDRPLFVEIPGAQGPLPGRKGLRRIVAEAVGISLGREEDE